MSLFSRIGANLINRSLDAQTSRQRTIAQNIANINTPGYTARRVRFEELLENQTGTKRESTKSQVYDSGKEVSMENEMTQLAKVQLAYSLSASNLSRRFRMLNDAIKGQNT